MRTVTSRTLCFNSVAGMRSVSFNPAVLAGAKRLSTMERRENSQEVFLHGIEIERPTVAGNAKLGYVSDVAAEMLRRLGIKYVVQNPGSSFAGLHDSLVNYLGNQDPTMMLALNEQVAVA